MLQVGIGTAASPVPDPDPPSLGLGDDGYYWFLQPLFAALAEETGQRIDLYGRASFAGDDLLALERMLRSATSLVEAQPESWAVVVGHAGSRGEVYMGVLKARMAALVAQWQALCAQAVASQRAIVCFGD